MGRCLSDTDHHRSGLGKIKAGEVGIYPVTYANADDPTDPKLSKCVSVTIIADSATHSVDQRFLLDVPTIRSDTTNGKDLAGENVIYKTSDNDLGSAIGSVDRKVRYSRVAKTADSLYVGISPVIILVIATVILYRLYRRRLNSNRG
jgi:hypothetical protein